MRKRHIHPLILCILLGLVTPPTVGQDQAPASVSGVLTNASTNAPLAGVLIMMTGAGVATTDESGRFALKDVLPGTWTIQALKTGMAPPARGSAPRVLTVRPGEEIRDVRLWLVPLAILRGKISDPDGNPLKGLRVEALVVAYQAGNRILQTPDPGVAGSVIATTGSDGEYQLELPPGKYYVAGNFTPPSQPEVSTSLNSGRTVRTYYPGTLNADLAATITVAGGETVYADFRAYKKGPELFRVSGRIVGAGSRPDRPGAGSSNRMFQLIPRDISGYAPSTSMFPEFRYGPNLASDAFELVGVPPGSYDLIITDQMSDGRRGRGVVPIEVRDEGIENLVVALHPGRDIEGKVIVRGASNAVSLERIAIRGGTAPVMAAADGNFTLPDVSEGRHSIRVDGFPPDAYVADIRQGTISLFDSAQTLAGPQYVVSDGYSDPLEVIVSPNGGVIEGVVEAATNQGVAGSAVVLVPGPTRRFVQTYYRSATVDSAGEFTFQGLAPGVYQIYAWESVPSTAWLNPDFVATYEGRSQSVPVEPGKRQRVRVRLIARED